MPTNPDSDNHLVEQPAMALLAELGWQTACGLEETFAPEGGSLGRRDRREVVLQPRLGAALEHLNPGQPPAVLEPCRPDRLQGHHQPHRFPERRVGAVLRVAAPAARGVEKGEVALLGVEEMTDNPVVSTGEASGKSGPVGGVSQFYAPAASIRRHGDGDLSASSGVRL
jgi:hypothetical protein